MMKFTKSTQQGGDKVHNKDAMKFTRNAQQGGDIVHIKKVMHYKEVTKFIKSAQQAPMKQ